MNQTEWMVIIYMVYIYLIIQMGTYLIHIQHIYIMGIMQRIGKNSIGLMSSFNKIILT